MSELQLRALTSATLMAVRRKGRLITNRDPDFRPETADAAILYGDHEQVDAPCDPLDPLVIGEPEPVVLV